MEAVNGIYKLVPEGAEAALSTIGAINRGNTNTGEKAGAINLPNNTQIIMPERSASDFSIAKIFKWIKNNWQLALLGVLAVVLLFKRL